LAGCPDHVVAFQGIVDLNTGLDDINWCRRLRIKRS
jgi:hypothetical protein